MNSLFFYGIKVKTPMITIVSILLLYEGKNCCNGVN